MLELVQALEPVLVVLALELELARVPAQELELARVQERVPVQVPVPHRQPNSRLATVPAGLIIFSFSSIKLLRLDSGRLKLLYC